MQHLLIMKRERQALESKVDFVLGLQEVADLIQNDPFPHEDTPHDLWFGNAELETQVQTFIQDEESKININLAEETLLKAFFKVLEDSGASLKGSSKDYVKEIVKLRQGKRLESLEELLLMENFEGQDLETLRPYLTVYTDSVLINLNTASSLILKALAESVPGDPGTRQIFMNRLEETCSLGREQDPKPQGCLFLSDDLRPVLFGNNLKLPKSPQMLAFKELFLASVTTDSETFSLEMKTKTGKQAKALFRLREGMLRPEVLGWHEE